MEPFLPPKTHKYKNNHTEIQLISSIAKLTLHCHYHHRGFFTPLPAKILSGMAFLLTSFKKDAVIRVSSDCSLDKTHCHLFHFNSLHYYFELSSVCVQINIYLMTTLISLTSSYPNHLISSTHPLEGLSHSFPQFYIQLLLCTTSKLHYPLPYFSLFSRLKTCLLTPHVHSRNLYLASLKPNGYVAHS